MHARALGLVDRMAGDIMGNLFHDLPGQDRLVDYVRRRARRELYKLSEERLTEFLDLLDHVTKTVRTGEGYDELAAAAEEASRRPREPEPEEVPVAG